MNQSVKTGLGIAVGTAVVGAAITAGYFYYTGRLPGFSVEASGSTDSVTSSAERKKKRNRSRKAPSSVTVESVPENSSSTLLKEKSASAPSITSDGPKKSIRLIDLPAEDIMALPPDKKEQVFYGLLIEGKEEEAVNMFVKALGMVPSPTDVLVAFEKSLPPATFAQILSRLQDSVRQRQVVYFDKISSIWFEFAVRSERNEATGSTLDHWAMKAKQDIPADTIILTEKPDVIFPTISGLASGLVTIDAFGPSDKSPSTSPYTSIQSNEDLNKDMLTNDENLKNFVDQLEAKGKESYTKLVEHCQKHGTSIPLLLLRYIAILMKLELKAQASGSSVSSSNLSTEESFFFSHYDNLRPALRSPSDADKREASLLRCIFDNNNGGDTSGIKDFLSNEIYTAMKYTLQFNAVGIPPPKDTQLDDNVESTNSNSSNGKKKSSSSSKEYVRWGGYTTSCQAIGIYHTVAHLDHSLEPNVYISGGSSDFGLTVTSSRPIKKGEFIVMSYLTSEDLQLGDKRSLLLAQHFGIFNTSS